MEKEIICKREIIKIDHQNKKVVIDEIAIEYPLTIFVNNEEFATLVCSPSHVEELVLGFLASEGMIRIKADVKALQIDEDKGFAYVHLHQPIGDKKEFVSKRFIGSCCGKSRQFYFYNDVKTAKTIMNSMTISAAQCFQLMEMLNEASSAFKRTGGIHHAALCSKEGLIKTFSDIGRHNALDKLYGFCLYENISLNDKIIAFSGRISSEVVLKVSKIGCGILLSKSAPTNLALQLAEDLNITTVGFIRENKMNIYTHSNRITK